MGYPPQIGSGDKMAKTHQMRRYRDKPEPLFISSNKFSKSNEKEEKEEEEDIV